MHDVDAGVQLQQFRCDVAGGAGALRGIAQLSGIGLGVGDQLLQGLGRHGRVHHQDVRHRHKQDDRREALQRLVGQALGEMRIHRKAGVIAHQHQVAVGRRLGDRVIGQHAISGWAILDHDGRGVARLAELLREHAGQDVADAGGRRRHEEFDRLRGKFVGARRRERRGCSDQRRRDADECTNAIHERPPPIEPRLGAVLRDRVHQREPALLDLGERAHAAPASRPSDRRSALRRSSPWISPGPRNPAPARTGPCRYAPWPRRCRAASPCGSDAPSRCNRRGCCASRPASGSGTWRRSTARRRRTSGRRRAGCRPRCVSSRGAPARRRARCRSGSRCRARRRDGGTACRSPRACGPGA